MMSKIYRCPDCSTEMVTKLVPRWNEDAYDEIYHCPNVENHGKTVECTNCGEQVKSNNQHYSYTPGLLGSGRWSCFRPRVES